MAEQKFTVEARAYSFNTDKRVSEEFNFEIPLISATNQNDASVKYVECEEEVK
jgi:hypothetical protein